MLPQQGRRERKRASRSWLGKVQRPLTCTQSFIGLKYSLSCDSLLLASPLWGRHHSASICHTLRLAHGLGSGLVSNLAFFLRWLRLVGIANSTSQRIIDGVVSFLFDCLLLLLLLTLRNLLDVPSAISFHEIAQVERLWPFGIVQICLDLEFVARTSVISPRIAEALHPLPIVWGRLFGRNKVLGLVGLCQGTLRADIGKSTRSLFWLDFGDGLHAVQRAYESSFHILCLLVRLAGVGTLQVVLCVQFVVVIVARNAREASGKAAEASSRTCVFINSALHDHVPPFLY